MQIFQIRQDSCENQALATRCSGTILPRILSIVAQCTSAMATARPTAHAVASSLRCLLD